VTTQPEPERDRLARNLSELLQELRVAQAGVQILFGFLLTVVFTQRYESADSLVHGLHLTAVLLAVAAITLLSATASWHRVLFRRSRREKIVRSGNWTALGGLVCVAGAMIATLGLVVDVVLGRGWAAVVAAVAGSAFVLLWFVLPLSLR
jgi:magnesium-transporting ATPase (P-type)